MNISIKFGSITEFRGDAIIVPCDSELTYKKIGSMHQVLELGGDGLVQELSAIGYGEIGHAVITQGYSLKPSHLIFMPIADRSDPKTKANFIDLHQSFRSALALAALYKTKSIAIPEIQPSRQKPNLLESISHKLTNDSTKPLTAGEIEDIILSVAKSFDHTTIKDLTIYRYASPKPTNQ